MVPRLGLSTRTPWWSEENRVAAQQHHGDAMKSHEFSEALFGGLLAFALAFCLLAWVLKLVGVL